MFRVLGIYNFGWFQDFMKIFIFLQYIVRRDELVSGDHAGYCEALEHILTNFKAVTHIGGCCGTLPEGIRSLQTRFF